MSLVGTGNVGNGTRGGKVERQDALARYHGVVAI